MEHPVDYHGEGTGCPLQYSGLENSMGSPWGRKESDTTERLSLHFKRDGDEKEARGWLHPL